MSNSFVSKHVKTEEGSQARLPCGAPSGQAMKIHHWVCALLRKHIVDFKSLFIQPDCVLKLIGFLSMEKYIPGKTLNYIMLTVQWPMRD